MQLLKLIYIYEAIIQFIEEKYPNQRIITLKSLKSKNIIITKLFKEIEDLEKNNEINF
ncbi:hypothetical protein KA405_00110 [Patescibacteria group bacterium]|nr:hypothetical protein [Patescibacteria group bacterium]